MFGMGGGEFFFILIIFLMFFGADKIPGIARTLGKGMAQLKNATNDIKSEISKSGIDVDSLTGGLASEITSAKEGFTKMVNTSAEQSGIQNELDQIRSNFAKMNEDEIAKVKAESNAATQIPPDVAIPEQNPDALASVEIPADVKIPEENPDGQIKRQL